jgi:pyruvate kinase
MGTLRAMARAGMDMARLNFSHGMHAEHERNFRSIRTISAKTGTPIGIIADLQGPKIRTGELAGPPLELRRGDTLVISPGDAKGTAGRISTSYKRLSSDVKPGDRILLDDGALEVRVQALEGRDVRCRVIHGGKLGAHKGINLPGITISEPSFTRKDRADARFAAKLGVDYFAMSFVRKPGDIRRLKKLLRSLNADIPVIAKIEKPEALDNIDGIIAAADGVMVARGDLGVEMPPEKVPQIQKDVIARCIAAGKPVITATQMLESMIKQPTPTRAEASDVVNAIYDGTDAVMLSGETAMGDYPVGAVRMMARIAEEADTYVSETVVEERRKRFRYDEKVRSFEKAIGEATDTVSRHIAARLIVCFTSSGFTAMQVSSYRPDVPIVAATQHEGILPRMSLYWGVEPIVVRRVQTVDAMIERVETELLARRMVRRGDHIVITAGFPLGVSGTTNMLQLVKVGTQAEDRDAKG